MQCNIDAKGKAIRLVSGLMVCLAALLLLVLWIAGVLTGRWPWIAAMALLAAGAFQIFEGWSGWCVLRAMGIKTRV